MHPWLSMARKFEPSDEGMEVRTSDDEVVGTIESVEGSTAHVKPEPGLSMTTRNRLNWGDDSKDIYTLRQSKVAEFSDEAIHLKD